MTKEFFYELIKYKKNVFTALMEDYENSSSTLQSVENALSKLKEDNTSLDFILANNNIQHFLSEYDNDYKWDYSNELSQLGLLPTKDLQELSLLFGVALYSKEISHILEKDEVLHIKSKLTEELYSFALERGQYLFHNAKEIFKNKNAQLPLLDRIQLHGELAIFLLSKSWTQSQKNKLSFFTTNPEKAEFALNEKDFQTLYYAVKKVLTLEVGSLLYV